MSTYACGGEDTLSVSAEDFLDLLCADEDLLDAEFEAIIAANWPGAPKPPSRRDRGDGEHRQPPPRRRDWRTPALGGERHLGDAWSRQRSPPSIDRG